MASCDTMLGNLKAPLQGSIALILAAIACLVVAIGANNSFWGVILAVGMAAAAFALMIAVRLLINNMPAFSNIKHCIDFTRDTSCTQGWNDGFPALLSIKSTADNAVLACLLAIPVALIPWGGGVFISGSDCAVYDINRANNWLYKSFEFTKKHLLFFISLHHMS